MPQLWRSGASLCECRSHESRADMTGTASPIPITPNGDSCCCQCSTARSRFTSTASAGYGVPYCTDPTSAVPKISESISNAAASSTRCIAVPCASVGARRRRTLARSAVPAYATRRRLAEVDEPLRVEHLGLERADDPDLHPADRGLDRAHLDRCPGRLADEERAAVADD